MADSWVLPFCVCCRSTSEAIAHYPLKLLPPPPPPLCRMLALAISEISSLVHRILLVASLAWQVRASRSPSISKKYGFEEIVANGFSEGKMQL